MNILTKAAICGGLAIMSLTAQAIVLVSPTPGSTTTVTAIKSITLRWDDVDGCPEDTQTAIVLNSEGTQVSKGTFDYPADINIYDEYVVTFNPAVEEVGTYTVVIPENLAGNTNQEYRLTFIVEANNSPVCIPTDIDPASSSDIRQSWMTPFTTIKLTFGNETSLVVDKNLISFVGPDNEKVPFEIFGWYLVDDPMLEWTDAPFVTIEYNEKGQLPSGVYTLTCNPGAFTSPRGVNEEKIIATYNYTKTKADADPTPLVISTALLGNLNKEDNVYSWDGTDAKPITTDMELAQLTGYGDLAEGEKGTAFLLTLNHGEKAGYVTATMKNNTTGELVIYDTHCDKQEDNTWLLYWYSTTKLFVDNDYTLEVRTYDNNYDQVEFGDGATLTFKGTSIPYKYSDAEYITAVPENGATINNSEQKITVLYSLPVKVTAQYAIGMGAGTVPMEVESASGDEYSNVWTTTVPEEVLKSYPEINITFVAYDENGLIVKGNNGGEEENSACELYYHLTVCQPRVLLKQTNSHVSELSVFNVYSSKGNAINYSWMGYPYLIDANGEKVATINLDYYEGEYMNLPFKPVVWSDGATEYDREPLELEFQLQPTITEKGKYTLVIPEYTFNFGTGLNGETSVPQTYDFYVSEFFPVNYTVDNNTIALQPVELGNNVVLTITPAAGWELSKLTLNDKDVTEGVENNVYTSEAAAAAMNFVAEFAFDGIANEPVSADEVVSDLNLRGWSEDGSLFVAGLKEGQVINVYTTGGSLMASSVVGTDDTMKYTLSAGVYIITVTEGNKTVALKLVNK